MADHPAQAAALLDALREIELLIADLYREFAQAFPEDEALWNELSRDEEAHALLAAKLKAMRGDLELPASVCKLHLAALGTYRKGLEYQLERLKRGELGRQSAMSIARDLERTLVERTSYDLVEGEDEGTRAATGRLRTETRSHLAKIEAAIIRTFGKAG